MRSSAGHRPVALLALTAALFAQPPAPRPPASVEGEVRNSVTGEPIERAHVVLNGAGGNPERYGTLTNAEGKFVIAGIPAGPYIYTLDRTGFVSAPNASANELKLQPGDKRENLKLKLTPTGAIVGHVYDADGVPVQGISVAVISGGQAERGATTDDRGQFRIGGLRAGKYRLKAQPQQNPFPPEIRTDGSAEVNYAATYYPAALDAASAMRVEVRPAVEATGVDIRLVRTPIVRVWGRVTGLPAGARNGFVSLRPNGAGAQAKPDGTFEIWRPNPGKYTIVAAGNHAGVQYSSAPLAIDIGQADVEDLALLVLPAEDIQGHIEFLDDDARKPAQTRRITLRGTDESTLATTIDEDGAFTLHAGPGNYQVMVSMPRVYVKSMALGPAHIDGGALNLSGGASGASLTLRIASAKGIVTGVVRDDKD